jgi:hypothetical protein
MKYRRKWKYRKYWDELVEIYGTTCFYCREEIAVVIDHVVPWSWDNDNNIENLVPSCVLCNHIACDKIFNDVEQKRQFILSRRKNKKLRRAICMDCMLPFSYREHSPSLLLCAECYDLEYNTARSKTKRWDDWIKIIELSGMIPEAHRKLRDNLWRFKPQDRKGKVQYLVDLYDEQIRQG